MQRVVIDEPYVPVPPYRGKFWHLALKHFLPLTLRKLYGVTRCECVGQERLAASLRAGHGIVLAPNHCRDEDPLVMGTLSTAVGSPFFTMASWHVFKQDWLKAFLLPRVGAFSVYREGIDRKAINAAVDIVALAERPLVIFPEGIISRLNDRINPLMDGVGLIARTAAKRRAQLEPPGRVVVHPVAIRYRHLGDIDAAVAGVLDEIETRLTWAPQRSRPVLERIAKVGNALLALKEIEHLGAVQQGSVAERIDRLINGLLAPLENEWVQGRHDDTVIVRVKRLRMAILPDMVKGDLDEPERQRRWRHLADAYLAQQLAHYPGGYLDDRPTPERMIETIERFEEDLTDKVRVHGPISATLSVGEAIAVGTAREARGAGDPLLAEIDRQLREMLGLAPPPVEKPAEA